MCLDPAVFGGDEAFDERMRTFVDDTRRSPPRAPNRCACRATRSASRRPATPPTASPGPRTGQRLYGLAADYGMDNLLPTTGIA